MYYCQEPYVKETIDTFIKHVQSNDRIYVDLFSKEINSLSERVRDPKVISNQKYASKEKNQNELMLTKALMQSARALLLNEMAVTLKFFHLDRE